jgi:hypothetical protein
LSELPTLLGANPRWLAGYRHERVGDTAVAARTREVIEHSPGVSLSVLAHRVGEPILVVPTIFHMLWRHEVEAELSHYELSRATSIYVRSENFVQFAVESHHVAEPQPGGSLVHPTTPGSSAGVARPGADELAGGGTRGDPAAPHATTRALIATASRVPDQPAEAGPDTL